MANVDSREELEGRVDVRNGVQPVQDSVEAFRAEMAVRAVWRGEAEISDPIGVIIQDKMNQLIRQIMQHRHQAEKVWLRQSGGSSPSKVHHGEPKVAVPGHAQGA